MMAGEGERFMLARRALLVGGLVALLGGCHPKPDAAHTLTIAATPIPHAQILRSVRRRLLKDGIGLHIREVGDYQTPNKMVEAGQVDLNYMQTRGNLAAWNAAHHGDLVALAAIHVEPLAAYSKKWSTLARLPEDATVTLPDEPSTVGRALRLLANANIIALRAGAPPTPTLSDIAHDPRHLRFRAVPPQDAAGTLKDVDLAFVNTNFALAAHLDPTRDALLIEGRNSPHVNVLVGRPGAAGDPRVRALVAALTSSQTRAFIQRRYKGAVIPAF